MKKLSKDKIYKHMRFDEKLSIYAVINGINKFVKLFREEYCHEKKIAIFNSRNKTMRIWLLSSSVVILSLSIFCQLALAQTEPLKINGIEVKEYLIEKYKLHKVHKDDLTSTLQQTPYGPSGKLYIMSENITPKTVIATGDIQTRAQAIAKAFLQEEAVLLGISNIDEIKEMSIDIFTSLYTNFTTTNIYYRRYINNLELENAYIQITIGHDGNIRSVSAELVAIPSELYEAVKKKTVTKDEAINIIKQDLLSNKIAPRDIMKLNITKIATQSQPYVVWKADVILSTGRFGYSINAFTGEIVKKRDTLVW